MRHIQLQGQPNFRDLGGYRTADGRTVARGEVYRSGGLAKLTDEDLYTLQGIGIRTVVSLLSSNEIKRYGPDRVWDRPDAWQRRGAGILRRAARRELSLWGHVTAMPARHPPSGRSVFSPFLPATDRPQTAQSPDLEAPHPKRP